MQQNAERQTILVVDDEPQVLVALEDLLSEDFLVLKSESAERALYLVEQEPDIAVVISDQRMPRMHGDELFKHLRARFGAERILATGFADLTAVIRAVNDGQIFAYVTKPWDPEDLRVKTQRAAEHFRLSRELAAERRLLEDLMSSTPDAIYFKDLGLNFQRVNHGLLQILGSASATDIVGRKLSEIFSDPELARAQEAQERTLLEDDTAVVDRITHATIAGERRWFSTSTAPIRARSGEPVGLVGIARDVTSRIQTEEALRNREEQLRLTFLASSAGLFDWDIVTGKVECSPNMAMMAPDASAGSGGRAAIESRLHPEDVAGLRQAIDRHLNEHAPLRAFELRALVAKDYRWFEISAQAVWDDAGRPTRLVGSATDISERKQQEARIERLTRIHAVLSGINSAILRVHGRPALLAESCSIAVRVGELGLAVATSMLDADADRVVAWDGASRGLVDAIGAWIVVESGRSGSIVNQAIATRRPVVVNDLRQQAVLAEDFAATLLGGGHPALAVLPVLISGQVNCVLALFADQANFFDEGQVKLLAELADNIGFALEHAAQAQRLDFLAYHDELTGLANRQNLTDRLAQQLAACSQDSTQLAVVLIDIERFRHVNETLGRRTGDEILIEVAQRLQAVTEGKWGLARYANNTFALVVDPLENEAGVAQWVEKALGFVGQSYMAAGTELRLASRVGISLFPSDGADSDALLANAEAALKKAKAGAQRYMFYTPEMNGRVAERLTLETKLRSAIEQNEFLLHYQPKVELKSGRVVGLEALIRWVGKDGKLIPPGLFIPLLEETGMIVDVGQWVIERAAAQHAEWMALGLSPPRIAVNVSPLQLGQPDFVHSLERVLSRFPGASAGLDLEITESVLMEDLVGNTKKLRQAKQAGLGVAIDDFGTGYSSLGYLSRLPIDALKIDRSFVMRMTDDPQEMSIVTTIISLAHALDLKVIAEGVETAQQAQLLRLLKCDQIQGYLVARPQPADSAQALLAKTFNFSKHADANDTRSE